MTSISIGPFTVGPGSPCLIIAEACDNHLGRMDVAREMIRQARLCGASAIKFQHHLPDEEMLREGMSMSANFTEHLYDFLKRCALTLDQHRQLKAYCDELGILYLCTPFSKRAAEEIRDLVPAFKIGSGELTDIPTLKVIASFGKAMILSTGMATLEEIDLTLEALQSLNSNVVLMNCTSEYPPRYEDINIRVVQVLKDRYQVPVGHSDHTPDIYTALAAVALGASVIEKHFILDRRQPGPDQSVSIEPFEFRQLVDGIRKVEAALGDAKQVHVLERPVRDWAHRSIVSLCDIEPGTVLTDKLVWTKRPGTGIPAKLLEEVLGKRAARHIPRDRLLSWADIEK